MSDDDIYSQTDDEVRSLPYRDHLPDMVCALSSTNPQYLAYIKQNKLSVEESFTQLGKKARYTVVTVLSRNGFGDVVVEETPIPIHTVILKQSYINLGYDETDTLSGSFYIRKGLLLEFKHNLMAIIRDPSIQESHSYLYKPADIIELAAFRNKREQRV